MEEKREMTHREWLDDFLSEEGDRRRHEQSMRAAEEFGRRLGRLHAELTFRRITRVILGREPSKAELKRWRGGEG